MMNDLSNRQVRKRLAKLGLTTDLFNVLDVLETEPDDGWPLGELAMMAGLTWEQMKENVQTLLDRGLATKRWTRFDRSDLRILLTAAGIEQIDVAREALGLECRTERHDGIEFTMREVLPPRRATSTTTH